MYEASCRKIGTDVFWLSIPDTESKRFERIWPIPNGVNYNAYLIGSDEDYLLIDASKKIVSANQFLELIKGVVEPSRIKQIAILHTEPDHSGLIEEASHLFPGAVLHSTSRASTFMKKMFNLEPKTVKDGESLKIGNRTLRVIELPWIHWPDSMFLYLEDEGILFSSDAFGAFGALPKPVFDDEVDFRTYLTQAKDYFSTVVVGHRTLVLHDIEKIQKLSLNVRMIAPAHGVVVKSKIHDFTQAMKSWCELRKTRKITVVYGSMYGLTERLAEFASQVLNEKVEEVAVHEATDQEVNSILSDVVDSAGTLFLAPTYEGSIFPPVGNLVELLRIKRLGQGKLAAALVTKLWGGNAPALLASKLKEAGYDLCEPVTDYVNYPSQQELERIRGFLLGFAEKALERT